MLWDHTRVSCYGLRSKVYRDTGVCMCEDVLTLYPEYISPLSLRSHSVQQNSVTVVPGVESIYYTKLPPPLNLLFTRCNHPVNCFLQVC